MSGQNNTRLTQAEIAQLILPTGRTVEQELKSAAISMVSYIQRGIDDYYASYSPALGSPYSRTGMLKRAVTFADIGSVTFSGTTASICINFNSNIWHPNAPIFSSHMSNVLSLIDQGWKVTNGWHRNIPHFGYQGGFHFIDNAIAKFNSNNPLGIEVK